MSKKPLLLWLGISLLAAFLITVLLPTLLVRSPHSPRIPEEEARAVTGKIEPEPGAVIPVYLSKERTIDRVPIEDYVLGVVAAEMPVTFEREAMKAQALAARTYVVRRAAERNTVGTADGEALVTDTVAHQAYWTTETMKQQWGGKYEQNLEKLKQAVKETEGAVITYEGKPIEATFFSTSNGYTENSEDYWGVYIPYLRSVPSPWDRNLSPRYRETVTFTLTQFTSKLGLSRSVPASALGAGMKVLETTAGHRVKKVRIGGTLFTGRDVREKLGLNSTQFEWRWKGTSVEVTTIGYGHGVGLSQWGANGMAKEGKTAAQIVQYYYTGVSIEKDDRFLR